MKRQLLFFAAFFLISSAIFAQTTILAQWTFPDGDTTDIYPDSCISSNSGKYISAEDTTAWPNTNLRDITFVAGASTFAAQAVGWNNGAGAKLWSIKIKTNGCTNITVSSKQSSCSVHYGPKYWKIQARLSNGAWIDVPNGNVICGIGWTTAVVTDLPLPGSFDNQTGSIYIRWIMTSDSSVANTIVDSTGMSRIDDVIIKGVSSSGIEEVIYNSNFKFYPNPNNNKSLLIESSRQIQKINIYNMQGQLIEAFENFKINKSLNLQTLENGIYFIKPIFTDNFSVKPQKLIIE